MKQRFNIKNSVSRAALVLVAGASLLAGYAAPAHAQATFYASTRRQVKACVLTFDPNLHPKYQSAPVPFLFYVMDSRPDLKPGGWDIINPLAPSTITGEVYNRWKGRAAADPAFQGGTAESQSFRLNGPLTKNMGAYWEFNLDKGSDDDIKQFDIALLSFSNNFAFNQAERERLRRFVDGGGTLWIENENGSTVSPNAPLFFNYTATSSGPANLPSQQHHPLFSFPNTFSAGEVYSLMNGGAAAFKPNVRGHKSDAAYLSPLVYAGGPGTNMALSAGDYGAGHLVISSAPIAVNAANAGGFGVYGANSGAVSGNVLQLASVNCLRFAYNVLAWTTASPTQGGNTRRTFSTGERVGTGLGIKWYAPTPGTLATGSPVIFKGVVFWGDSAGILHAYDRDPIQVLYGNSTDDGIPDFAFGTPYDEIWHSDKLGARLSTPTVVSGRDSSGAPYDRVAVMNNNGITYLFDAFPNNPLNPPSPITVKGPTNLPIQNTLFPLPAPAYSEGVLFTLVPAFGSTGTNPWRVAAVSAATGASIFEPSSYGPPVAPAPSLANSTGLDGFPEPIGPITVGYVHDDATGAQDKMIYVPTLPQQVNGIQVGIMAAVWFGSKNEPLERMTGNSGGLVPRVFFQPQGERKFAPWNLTPSQQGLDIMPHVYLHPQNGLDIQLAYNTDYTVTYEGGNGAPHTIRVAVNEALIKDPSYEVFADYTLNWSGADLPNSTGTDTVMAVGDMTRFSTQRSFPVIGPTIKGTLASTTLTGGAALSPQDYLIFNTLIAGATGRTYAVHEQYNIGNATSGKTRSRTVSIGTEVAWMFAPYENGLAAGIGWEARLVNNDTTCWNAIGGYVTGFTPVGSPAVSNGTTYVVGTANVNNIPAVVVLALRSNPPMSFSIGTPIPSGASVVVEQININQPNGNSPVYNRLTEGQNFSMDRDSGTFTIFDSRQGNADVINTALPMHIEMTVAGTKTTYDLPDPNAPGYNGVGPLDNLSWFMAIPRTSQISNNTQLGLQGATPTSGPSVIGDMLYFGTTSGHVVAVDLRGSGGAQHFGAVGTPPNVTPRFRVLKDGLLDGGTILEPPTGTERTLVLGNASGIAAMDARPTLIADNNRLLEVDYGCNAIWSLDATLSYFPAGSDTFAKGTASVRTGFARPGVTHRLGLDQFFVADTNNNRIVLTDRGGTTLWELHDFNNDLGVLPPGYPLTLSGPSDVQTVTEYNVSGTITADDGTRVTYNAATLYHYFIADSGNYRAIEIVDGYDQNGDPVKASNGAALFHQIAFTTRSLSEQKARYHYRTIQQFADDKGSLFMVAAVDNVSRGTNDPLAQGLGSSNISQDTSGGAIVVFRRNPPAPARDGSVTAIITSLLLPDGTRQKISNPVWFKETPAPNYSDQTKIVPHYLLADDNGCYDIQPIAGVAKVYWMLSAKKYFDLTGRPLQPASIQRLTQADPLQDASGNIAQWIPRFLITNRYDGPDNVADQFGLGRNKVSQIHGEVFEIKGVDFFKPSGYQNLYASNNKGPGIVMNNNSSIVWVCPYENAVQVLENGKFVKVIQKTIGSDDGATRTYLLQQPSFAERPY